MPKTPKVRMSGSQGPKNAPAPRIARPVINKHTTAVPNEKLHPEMYPQQLNPVKGPPGQPQYRDETPIPGNYLRALIAHLRNS